MRTISTSVQIDVPLADAWAFLSNFKRYPEWNPYLRRVCGELRSGATISVDLQPEKGPVRTFQREVMDVVDGSHFSWRSQILSPWVFQGYHTFRVSECGSAATLFENLEEFSGFLVPLMWPFVSQSIQGRFEAMNNEMKRVLE